jgi:hypothetical protein
MICLIPCAFVDDFDFNLRDLKLERPLAISGVVFTFTLLGSHWLLVGSGLAASETRRGVVSVQPDEAARNYLRAHTRPGRRIYSSTHIMRYTTI